MQEINREVSSFIKNFSFEDIPQEVVKQAKICVLDLLGAALGGSQTKAARLARQFALKTWPGNEAAVFMAGANAGCIGATFANAVQANAIDIDDGFREVKGHPGALVIPAALAVAQAQQLTGRELIEAIVVGYEVGTRAGIIWHHMYPVYHASGAWGAVAAAATAAKLLKLNDQEIANALGIAEYQAPINPMMRCIDYPAMVKDGIGWGAQVGVTSALMAAEGFTGIPSLFGYEQYRDLLAALGKDFKMLRLYFKPFACCRWAQPAIYGTLKLMQEHQIKTEQIQRIDVYTFAESARLKNDPPRNTEEAQYNISFPIAAAVYDGEVGPQQIVADKLNHPKILALMNKINIIADARFDADFPRMAQSEVQITVAAGDTFSSGIMQAKGDFDNPLTGEELKDKYFWLASQVKPKQQAEEIYALVDNLENLAEIKQLCSLL